MLKKIALFGIIFFGNLFAAAAEELPERTFHQFLNLPVELQEKVVFYMAKPDKDNFRLANTYTYRLAKRGITLNMKTVQEEDAPYISEFLKKHKDLSTLEIRVKGPQKNLGILRDAWKLLEKDPSCLEVLPSHVILNARYTPDSLDPADYPNSRTLQVNGVDPLLRYFCVSRRNREESCLSDEDVGMISQLIGLKKLRLEGTSALEMLHLSSQKLELITQNLIQIEDLDISCNKIGFGEIQVIGRNLKFLKRLKADQTDMRDIQALAISENLKGLQELDISYNQIGNAGILEIARELRGLLVLDISGNKEIDLRTAAEIKRLLPSTRISAPHLGLIDTESAEHQAMMRAFAQGIIFN